jgi:hypothetical protein
VSVSSGSDTKSSEPVNSKNSESINNKNFEID